MKGNRDSNNHAKDMMTTDLRACPVCGMSVMSGAHMVEHLGLQFLCCSLPCKQAFQQSPDMYVHMSTERIREKNIELELIRRETVACLSRAAEYKDNETGKHNLRIATYSQLLASLAGLPDEHVELIRETAPLHDVGKIGVPEKILLKPGPLNAEERSVIEKHSEIGASILGKNSQSTLMTMASTIALTHHEKWNGEGYPRGLIGENIPIEGRIVAICDVFDALASVRPYKTSWPMMDIKDYLIAQQGKHFDPKLAQLFIQNFKQFEEIYYQLEDGAR